MLPFLGMHTTGISPEALQGKQHPPLHEASGTGSVRVCWESHRLSSMRVFFFPGILKDTQQLSGFHYYSNHTGEHEASSFLVLFNAVETAGFYHALGIGYQEGRGRGGRY